MTVFSVNDPTNGSGNRDLFRPTAENTASKSVRPPQLTEWIHTDGHVTYVFEFNGNVNGWSYRTQDGEVLFATSPNVSHNVFYAALEAPTSEPMRQLLFSGNDSITGGVAANVLDGLGGADTISGAAGNDTIDGGDGQSYLRGDDGDDRITGGADFDDINGNTGNDTASGGGGDDWVVGGKDNDSLAGGAGADLVYGNIGADTCEGGDGNDIVRGGQDADVLFGGAGDDYLSGDRGHDTLTGGSGADTFHSFGEAETDRVTDFNRAEGDRILLDAGTTYEVTQSGDDVIVNLGGGGRVVLEGVSMASLTGDWIVVG
ncbi:calcium-binding protein [Phenylobacterium sp.]|uniref:calcium-binding protein n=1 Tax=Phenylobacterium sp. TaxID=1871053 RepID=UPI0025D84CC9|nr:calcium-binding protein [Phenylobacterium sp.]